MNIQIVNYLSRLVAIFTFLLLTSCQDEKVLDNQTAGSIKVSIDETYKPVMEEQLKIFHSRFPNAHITAEYKPEAECFKDFFEDTTRVIFVTRELSEEEKQYCLNKQWVTKSMAMARDAIVFITAGSEVKSEFKLSKIKEYLTGADSSYQIVFDNKSSSTVRYITDSLIPGKALSSHIFATNTSEEVIDYVSKKKNAIGVIGVSWVADHKDSTVETFLKKINVAGIWPDNDSIKAFVKPYQAYIGLREYPCTRNFYFISKESWQGLGTGLVNYLCRDGQLVFRQAKLFPLRVNVLLRETRVNK
jgi:phosphate transport system substrate-binding protein